MKVSSNRKLAFMLFRELLENLKALFLILIVGGGHLFFY